ncbi:hypothetical protein T11_15437 [Trichinella zimbabwensis]|uniref:Uncharacterized protein n=1 Tax=Trichinella zimbabwensis TaxID=268475 RepID=A0A0V1DLY6_9BILA|nr:hypothetical protein T11_15437 [Trichinella zimbabwensis]
MNYSLGCFGVFGENFFVKFLGLFARNRSNAVEQKLSQCLS